MLRTFSGRQPHPAAAAEAPQPGSDPSADAAVAPPLPERTGTPSQDADAALDAAVRVDLPAGEEPPPAGSVAAGEAEWEAQLAALEAAKAARRASSAAPRSPDHGAPAGIGDDKEDASDDSDAEDDELTAAIAEARIAARRLSLSVDADPAPPPPPTRTRSAPVPHKRRLSHEERATPLSHLKHLLMPSTRSASDRPASPPVPVARASMAAARDGFARRGEKLEGVNRATEGRAEAARQYRENARKREADARKSRSRWF